MVNIRAEKLEIEQLIKRVEAAENRHDVDAMLEDMTVDPLFHLCGVPPVKGHDAVRQLYKLYLHKHHLQANPGLFLGRDGVGLWRLPQSI